jgi:hypothetical protein
MNEESDPYTRHDQPSKPRIVDPRMPVHKCTKNGCARLQIGDGECAQKEEEEYKPVADGAARKRRNIVPLRLSRELVPIPGYNKKIYNVFADGSPIIPPNWRNVVEDERQSVHSKLPDMLVLILVAFF